MKKTLGLVFLLVLVFFGIIFLDNDKSKVLLVDGVKTPLAVELSYDMGKLRLHPWYDGENDIWYVFFPSFIEEDVIDCSKLQQDGLLVNGEAIRREFTWQDNVCYEFVYGENIMQMVFLKDKNLPSLFVETDSKANDIIREAKENEEKGHIVSLDNYGKVQYSGAMTISGHGNAWQFYDKRAYDIQLNNKGALAGMDANSHWKLLHLSNDGDKIHSKLAYDIAEILGSEYVPQTTWANVYLNGEYYGMYLLATAVRDQDVFKTDDAVLLEKDLADRYRIEEHIVSEEGNGFTIHRPKYPDERRKEEILQMVQRIEDSIASGEMDERLIDVDSFVIQFLVDEITINGDGFETSAYVYQPAKGKPLYAGPPWDYDAAFGEALHGGKNHANTEGSVLDGEHTELTWYQKLYDNPEFVKRVADKYRYAMPQLRELYEETIDLYAEYIEGSVRNDYVRWKGNFITEPKTGTYQTWENNLRYLKYFCYNRHNALMERWEIEGEELVWEGTGQEHTVRVLYGGQEKILSVLDGETLDLVQSEGDLVTAQENDNLSIGEESFVAAESGLELKEISRFYDQEGCVAKIGYSQEEFSEYLPALEDFSVELTLQPQVRTTEVGKFVKLPKDMFVEETVYVSIFDIDAEGNAAPVLSAEPMRDLYLEYGAEATGTIAVYVFSDETGANVVDEITLEY